MQGARSDYRCMYILQRIHGEAKHDTEELTHATMAPKIVKPAVTQHAT
jgi:hypothetical protein